jgi:hypothetical protein
MRYSGLHADTFLTDDLGDPEVASIVLVNSFEGDKIG